MSNILQVGQIEMTLGSADANHIELIADELLMRLDLEMNLFTITDYHIVNMTYPLKGVKMEITFKRKIMSEMMTTYLPSLLLMMITFATTFFKPFFFEAALSVNLTTMLVMTTIFISKMESLPPTSVTKMIDYWLILCQLVPFAQVVLLTVKEFLRKEEQHVLENNSIRAPSIKDNLNIDVEEKTDSKEAWTISQREMSTASSQPMFEMIGRGRLQKNPTNFFCIKLQKTFKIPHEIFNI